MNNQRAYKFWQAVGFKDYARHVGASRLLPQGGLPLKAEQVFACHSERSEESPVGVPLVQEILRCAQNDKKRMG